MEREADSETNLLGNGEESMEVAATYEVSDDETVTQAVVAAVAAVAGERPEALPPLYDTVDTEALDTLFERASEDTTDRIGVVTFPYAGRVISVRANPAISVEVS